jgi:RHS repeat-associated protein
MALSEEDGVAVERYDYEDFGTPLFFDSSGTPVPASISFNAFLFSGLRSDPESGLYYYRSRYLDPFAGRFTIRDIISIWGDYHAAGNGYSFVGNNPMSSLDPQGLYVCDPLGHCSTDVKGLRTCHGARAEEGVPEAVVGQVACSGGSMSPCLFAERESVEQYSRDSYRLCALKHEERHMMDSKKCPDCKTKPYFLPPKSERNRQHQECNAYRRELDCLREEKKAVCARWANQKACREAFDRLIKQTKGAAQQSLDGAPCTGL